MNAWYALKMHKRKCLIFLLKTSWVQLYIKQLFVNYSYFSKSGKFDLDTLQISYPPNRYNLSKIKVKSCNLQNWRYNNFWFIYLTYCTYILIKFHLQFQSKHYSRLIQNTSKICNNFCLRKNFNGILPEFHKHTFVFKKSLHYIYFYCYYEN